MPICSEGHTTVAEDYCDVCGSSLAIPADSPASSGTQTCPSCRAPVIGRFCEACGRDTASPEPAAETAPAAVEWRAVVTADGDYYKRVVGRGGPDTVDFPDFFPERRITLADNTLIGRTNRRQGVRPGIDLGINPIDFGVSTQHAVLRIREGRLTITDLGSTNGTSLNDSEELLGNGEETALADGDRIHVGAWTTITVERSGRS